MTHPRGVTGAWLAAILLLAGQASTTLDAWGQQGHRLVAMIANSRLTPAARRHVEWLLGNESLADVAVWADQYLEGNNQTSFWHYLNIPRNATGYDRDRDCPRQPGVAAGARGDRWRDCAVDRILYNEARLADAALDRADRAIALKFLVHLVGDLHQPFHALGVERGGNGIRVSAFGSTTCGATPAATVPCNLHGIWDTSLVAHRRLRDGQYLMRLEQEIARRRFGSAPVGTPPDWAIQSHALAKAALVAPDAHIDEAYYQRHIPVVDERLALGGVRLAALLNRSLTGAPPTR